MKIKKPCGNIFEIHPGSHVYAFWEDGSEFYKEWDQFSEETQNLLLMQQKQLKLKLAEMEDVCKTQ